MKKILVYAFCLCFAFTCFTTQVHAKEEFPQLRSQHAIVINIEDDRILYEKASDVKIYPASMTKIMTTLLAIENIEDMNQTYTFDDSFFALLRKENASVAGFKDGQTVTMQDLLYGILLPSGADATLAMADFLFGSEEAFVDKMNEKAKAIKLKNTHFMNTSGLHDEKHYSTVSDIAKLLKYALKNPLFKEIFKSQKYLTSDKTLTLYSTLVQQAGRIATDTSMIVGSKTGFTNEAALCLASLGQVGEEEYIMVSAQTNSDSAYPYHIEDAAKMYTYLHNHYERRKIITKKKTIKKIKFSDGREETYLVKSTKDVFAVVPKAEKIEKLWKGVEEIEVPSYSDTYIGVYEIKVAGKTIASQKFYLDYNVEDRSPFAIAFKFIKEHFVSFALVLLIWFCVVVWYFYTKLKKENKDR